MAVENQNKWRGRVLRYAPLIVWTCVVLFASTGAASMSETSHFIRPLLHFLFPNTPEEILTIYHGYIRKLAHLTEYAILGFFAARAFANSSKNLLRRYRFFFAFAVVVFVACTDEFNQSYNAARTGSIYDVFLDCSGGLTMIFVFAVWTKIREKREV